MTNADFYANLNDTQYKKYINQLIYNILLPIAFDHGFDYSVPDGIRVEPGDYVWVSFGRRRVCGVVWGPAEGGVAQEKIKAIESVAAHVPPMPETMRGFIDWVARYTLSSRGNVLRMALHDDALESPKQEVRYMIAQPVPEILRMTPARQRVVAYLSDFTARTRKEITTHAKVTDAVFRDAVAQGLLIAQMEMPLQLPRLEKDDTKPHKHTDASLSAEQQHAFETIDSHSGFHVTLLDGVTGSGKTEVYFALIEKQLRRGKQVLVLLPEIGLSVQWLTRYEARFGASPHLWHSEVSPAKKRETWRAVATGDAKVVVGARSALFLPFKHLALIIVDEEHDHSYKQEDGVYYQSRDMAVLRAQKEQVPIVLVSATPSLETVVNVEQKKYDVVHLRARYAEAELPTIEMIDMRQERLPSGTFLSAHLKAQMVKALDAGGQVMLFLNRRGYAPLVLCKSCGHRFQCPNCATWLVMHKKKVVSSQLLVASHSTNNQQLTTNNLTCHHCGHTSHIPETCPSCAAKESFMAYGPGVDRIAEEVKTFIPNARIGTMTSDSYTDGGTGSGSEATRGGETAEPERGKRSPHDVIRGMESGAYDILVGTQMVAKGHHFGNLTLVGVVDADMGLSGGDLRAGERTYQLLHQLSGRAGREKKRGHVLMQSYMPEHPVMQALVRGERDRFMQLEMQMRSDANMPPFGRLAAVIIEGNDEQSVLAVARELARTAPNSYAGLGHRERSDPGRVGDSTNPNGACLRQDGSEGGTVQSKTGRASPGEAFPPLTILGPTPAPLFKLRGKTRYRFLIKADRQAPLQKILSNWIFNVKTPSTVRIKIDIDPYSFL
jgi:primosomal protein N' (replication factor Y)